MRHLLCSFFFLLELKLHLTDAKQSRKGNYKVTKRKGGQGHLHRKLDKVPSWPWRRRPTRGPSHAMKHHKMTQSVGIETLEPPTSKDAAVGSPYLPHGGH